MVGLSLFFSFFHLVEGVLLLAKSNSALLIFWWFWFGFLIIFKFFLVLCPSVLQKQEKKFPLLKCGV